MTKRPQKTTPSQWDSFGTALFAALFAEVADRSPTEHSSGQTRELCWTPWALTIDWPVMFRAAQVRTLHAESRYEVHTLVSVEMPVAEAAKRIIGVLDALDAHFRVAPSSCVGDSR